jgi:hypothetical protein
LKINSTQQYYARGIAVQKQQQQQRGAGSWKETARTRRNNSIFRKTVLPHISNTRKGIVLEGRQILLVSITSKIISEKRLLRNTFG